MWIPVTERLPEPGSVVIAWNGTRAGEVTFKAKRTGRTKREREPHWQWCGYTVDKITHWMPLPEPPK